MGCTNTALTESGARKHGCPDSGAPNQGQPAIPLYNSTQPRCATPGSPVCSGDVVQQPADLTTLDDFYAQTVHNFLARHAAGGPLEGVPFFAYVPFSHVHVPLSHNPRFQNKSKRNTLFADTLLEMDDTFGRIMASLEQLSLDFNTVVLVVGDNGPWNAYCNDAGSQGPFIGGWLAATNKSWAKAGTGKFTQWEGGHREASFAYWPAGIKNPGRVSATTLHVVDVLPTLASLAGVALPADRHYDGVDFSAILTSGGDAPVSPPRDFLFHQVGDRLMAARHKHYQAHWTTLGAAGCDGGGAPQLDHDPPLVFDLDADPGETTAIDPPPGLVDAFNAARAALQADIANSFHTQSNYSSGGFDWWACCNATNADCQCSL
jgi:arylsulfatase A-like enzyme